MIPRVRMEPEHFAAVTGAMMALRRARAAELFALDLEHVDRFGRHVDALEDPEARAAVERDALAATANDAAILEADENPNEDSAAQLTEQFRERYAEAGIDGAMQLAAETFGSSGAERPTVIEEVCRGHKRFVVQFSGRLADSTTEPTSRLQH